MKATRRTRVDQRERSRDPKHARYRNGMAQRLERIERDVADIKGRARYQVDAIAADGAADGQADGQGDQTKIRRTVERCCRAERQRNAPRQDARR